MKITVRLSLGNGEVSIEGESADEIISRLGEIRRLVGKLNSMSEEFSNPQNAEEKVEPPEINDVTFD